MLFWLSGHLLWATAGLGAIGYGLLYWFNRHNPLGDALGLCLGYALAPVYAISLLVRSALAMVALAVLHGYRLRLRWWRLQRYRYRRSIPA